jgi:hypothetical protein
VPAASRKASFTYEVILSQDLQNVNRMQEANMLWFFRPFDLYRAFGYKPIKCLKGVLNMKKTMMVVSAFLCVSLMFTACGGGKAPEKPGADSASASLPADSTAAPALAKSGMQKIGDMADAWNDLYKQNEAVINRYDGMPIMGLVTPPLTFVSTVQFDLLNIDNKDGRIEGKLMFAGYNGFVEKAGAKITFGYDHKLQKDGFGPSAKAGDRNVENGSLALDKEYYISEAFTERAGRKISRSYHEFKRLGDKSMICLVFGGKTFNGKGDEDISDDVIFLHNGKDQYDFVIAKAETGPEFKSISFADKGDLTKEQAIELFKAAGYAIDQSGGIKDGKLVVDK